MRRAPQSEHDLPQAAADEVPRNAMHLVGATALQSSGDHMVSASTVLPWLFHALGVPPALVGLLVPIRESGSMLPQAMLTPTVLRVAHRKWVFVTGALVQAVAIAVMAFTAAVASGLLAGVAILLALAVFSLGRSLTSISSKDVQGRTIPKGERGQINGLATTASGLVAITLGLSLRTLGGDDVDPSQLAWMLAAGAVLWVAAAAIYARVREPAGETSPPSDAPSMTEADSSDGWVASSIALLREDQPFRHFVLMRSLLLVSALSPPFIVAEAVRSGTGTLGGLGGFVIAAGFSALIGGPIFGRLADRSSRLLMAAGAGVASGILVGFVIVTGLPEFNAASIGATALFICTYFSLTLIHTGVRVGRKTYLVDMAEGDQRTRYVAVSNTAMGVILLIAGAVSALLSTWGVDWALLFLAALGVLGAVTAVRLPEVSAG